MLNCKIRLIKKSPLLVNAQAATAAVQNKFNSCTIIITYPGGAYSVVRRLFWISETLQESFADFWRFLPIFGIFLTKFSRIIFLEILELPPVCRGQVRLVGAFRGNWELGAKSPIGYLYVSRKA